MQFKLAIYAADQSRPVTGNTVQASYLDGRLVDSFSQAMDVQSFSYEYWAYSQVSNSTYQRKLRLNFSSHVYF